MTEADRDLVAAYKICFGSPAGQEVLLDLMKFCKFRVAIDNQIDEGKRQVFLRIETFVALTIEQIHWLFSDRTISLQRDMDE
jgi:hypothetical protein